ncbi:C40 family peptidase [Streptomyces avermitilis]|uniref:C40 family peptidase n=1 Tax=Streptomyces avermitilis TaxID=33903 RepID=UPI0034012D11
MASEGNPHPGGISLPGPRNSVPATAALTPALPSSQSADARPLEEDDRPSRVEVQQRVNSLYDQAETATGNYNATRAMSAGARRPVTPARSQARRRVDPALDEITQQWFDAARAKLGPIVPAVLPADRMPARQAESRPAGRPEDGLVVRERPDTPAVRELTTRPIAALPPAAPRAETQPETRPQPLALTQAQPQALALPEAPKALPAAPSETPQNPLRTAKKQFQRKLAEARELLSRHTAPQSTPLAAIEARPAEVAWHAMEEQGRQQGWDEGLPLPSASVIGTALPTGAPYLDTTSPLDTAPYLDTAAPLDTAPYLDTASPLDTAPYLDTTPSVGTTPSVDTWRSLGAGTAPEPGYDRKAMTALAFARAQIGRPCVWGATGPDSYDCSSLTQAAWKAAGVALPRTAPQQASTGTEIPLTDLRPGDLIFFYDNLSHVGLFTGGGMMIHAPSPGASLREESIFFAGNAAIQGAVRPT